MQIHFGPGETMQSIVEKHLQCMVLNTLEATAQGIVLYTI